MKLRALFYYVLALLVVSAVASRAQASPVIYQDFQFVSSSTVSATPFDVTTPGTYKADLVDFEFPSPFDVLSLGITQGLTPLGIGFGTDSFTFDVTTPGTLLAHLAAIPAAGGGLYAFRISPLPAPPVPVPLPASLWLFLSALTGMVAVARRDPEPGAL